MASEQGSVSTERYPSPADTTVDAQEEVHKEASPSVSIGQKRKSASPSPEPIQTAVKEEFEDDDDEEEEEEETRPKRRRKITPSVVNNAPTKRLEVYVFGSNASNELGLNTEEKQVSAPTRNTKLAGDKLGVVQFAAGGAHCAALTHDNVILTWGANGEGQLGRHSTTTSKDGKSAEVPAAVDMEYFPEDTVFVQLVATENATFVLTEDGLVYGWGTFIGNNGVLGFSPKTKYQRTPAFIPDLRDVTSLAAGAQHVLALTSRGAVFAWGSGEENQLGRRMQGRMRNPTLCLTPRQCALPPDAARLGAGTHHSFAIRKNGEIYAWGSNTFGQTGHPLDTVADGVVVETAVLLPAEAWALRGHRVSSIVGGREHSLAVTEDGRCLSWGRIGGMALGIKKEDMATDDIVTIRVHGDVVVEEAEAEAEEDSLILAAPTLVTEIEGKVVFATAGNAHSLVVTKKGQVYGWGANTWSQTGQVEDEAVEVPTLIQVDEEKFVSAAAGGEFSVLLSKV